MSITDLKPLFDAELFGDSPIILAGPCSAESEAQVLEAARALSKEGIKIFRAGVWKPRTKPGGFEGIGSPALSWLRKVKEETGMLTATEVANTRHLEEALAAGIDVLWIGARTSANPFAVQELADIFRLTDSRAPRLAHRVGKESCKPRPRALDRRAGANLRLRHTPPRSHSSRFQLLRQAYLS